jgi:AcrR family transcriptional regulator
VPRKYDMSRRAAAVEETKRRIVQATMDLHNSQGILATSWEDIARRADVAPATVYRHFPTLDELLPACGALSMEQIGLPTFDEVEAAFVGVRRRRARLRRLVELVFGIYARGADVLAEMRRSRAQLDLVQTYYDELEALLDRIVAVALGPLGVADRDARVIRGLVDFDVWRALGARGIEGEKAVEAMVELLDAWLSRRR